LNTGTLAITMFVAFALLSNTRGKDIETRESVPAAAIKSGVVIDERHDDVSNVVIESVGEKMSGLPTVWQFISGIINAFKGAFTDLSLSEYAKQQGIDISDSLTTPCPNTSTTSKSLSNQSSKPSSSY
jgi:hypothetical protein